MASSATQINFTHWGPSDPGAALLLGIAIGLLPLAIAYWPGVVAAVAEHRRPSSKLPAGATPFVTGELSGLSAIYLFACGLMWIIARPPAGGPKASGQAVAESSAEAYLGDTICPQGTLGGDVQNEARHLLASNDPTTYEMRAAMAGLRESARDDARNLGLLRKGALIRKLLLALAGVELIFAIFDAGNIWSMTVSQTLLWGGLITAFAALHVDQRSLAGALLSGHLRRLRTDLRKAALATGAIDSTAVRSLVPGRTNAAEAEVWAVSVGCRTAGSQRAAARVRSITHAEEGRPRLIRYTEAMTLTGERLAGSFLARLTHLGRRRDSNGARPVLW
ncbi:MAG: hypothetical protein ABSB75_05230 [Candidatus Limnocylindrales bacterium]